MLIATSYSHTTFIALFPLLVVCSPVRHNDEFEAAEHQEFGQEAGADSLGDFLETPESVSDFHLAADTADSDKEPPKWVSGARLSASNVGPNQVQLLWEGASYEGPGPAVDNVGIAAFAVYRDGQAIATVGAELHSYINTGLQPDTNYLFQIQAGDKAGNWSTDGPSLAVNTECSTYWFDRCPVSWPAGSVLVATKTGSATISLLWTPAYDNTAVYAYRVLQDGKCLCGNVVGVPTMDYTVNGETTEYMVLGLSAGVVYHFQISARDSVSETAGGGGWIIGPEIDTSL